MAVIIRSFILMDAGTHVRVKAMSVAAGGSYNQDKLDRAVIEIVGKVTETRSSVRRVMNTVGDREFIGCL